MASALPQLVAGGDEDEVGYRIDTWTDRDRGRLIVDLNNLGILHRFEEDELVVGAEDEERVDDLVAELSEAPLSVIEDPLLAGDLPGAAVAQDDDPALDRAVHRLDAAAGRLRDDPTDMQADADVAESSAAIFMADTYRGCSEDDWAAIGRVTRRLLAVLGADEALEGEIKSEATLLKKLLDRLLQPPSPEPESGLTGEQTEYEFPEWLPEQRAQLGMFLDEAGIPYRWDGDDLLVPPDRETEVEALFEKVEGGEEGDEDRYTAVEELFAACGRLAADPTDEQRMQTVLQWAEEVQGPPLLGMDVADWLRIMSRVRALVTAIDEDEGADIVLDEAQAVHDLLRAVV